MFDKLPIASPSPGLIALDAALFAVFAGLAVVWIFTVRTKTDNPMAVIFHGIFACYLVFLACIVFLPLHGFREAAGSFDATHPIRRAWFWGLQPHNPMAAGQLEWQRFANVVMMIPFGFGFGLLAPRLGFRRIFVACIGWAVSLELTQLSISLIIGFVYRTFDINDIIDNVLGAWIGLGLFVVVALAVKDTGFGAHAPVTSASGFIHDSVDRYFAARPTSSQTNLLGDEHPHVGKGAGAQDTAGSDSHD